MTRRTILRSLPVFISAIGLGQEKYSGPKPATKDTPYLLHGEKLIATEVQKATESNSKGGQAFSVTGATSPVRTPLAEPIFLFSPEHLKAEQLGLFRFEVRNGHREVVISGKHKGQDADRVFHLTIRHLDENVFRLEASEMQDAGEYALSPEGENTAFCFTVY